MNIPTLTNIVIETLILFVFFASCGGSALQAGRYHPRPWWGIRLFKAGTTFYSSWPVNALGGSPEPYNKDRFNNSKGSCSTGSRHMRRSYHDFLENPRGRHP